MDKRALVVDLLNRRSVVIFMEDQIQFAINNIDHALSKLTVHQRQAIELRYPDNPVDPTTGKRTNTLAEISRFLTNKTRIKVARICITPSAVQGRLDRAATVICKMVFWLLEPSEAQRRHWYTNVLNMATDTFGWWYDFELILQDPTTKTRSGIRFIKQDELNNNPDVERAIVNWVNWRYYRNRDCYFGGEFLIAMIGTKMCFVCGINMLGNKDLTILSTMNTKPTTILDITIGPDQTPIKHIPIQLFDAEVLNDYRVKLNKENIPSYLTTVLIDQ